MERIQHLDPLTMAGLFFISCGINYLYTLEVQKIERKEALKAGIASAANVLLASVLLYAFIENPLNAIPEMLGAFTGTYFQTKRK